MEIQPENRVLAIRDIHELNVGFIRTFREAVSHAARLGLGTIELDLSQVGSVDASALGVLASIYRLVGGRPPLAMAVVRLLNPQPAVQQMLELTRMDLLFEIITTRRLQAETESLHATDFLQAA